MKLSHISPAAIIISSLCLLSSCEADLELNDSVYFSLKAGVGDGGMKADDFLKIEPASLFK